MCSKSDEEEGALEWSTKTLRTQGALGAGNFTLSAPNPRGGHAECEGQGLEGTLGPVVVVFAAEAVDMQGDLGGLGETLHAVRQHLCVEFADAVPYDAQVDDAVGAVGQVDNGAREGLVQWGVGVAEAGEAGGGAEGLVEGFAEGDAAILGRVVGVDCGGKRRQRGTPEYRRGATDLLGRGPSWIARQETNRHALPGRAACGRGSQFWCGR